MKPYAFDTLLDRQPPYNAWGAWGPDDEFGRLNLIDAASVKRGNDSVKHGITIGLNLPLKGPMINAGRGGLTHEVVHRGHANDDKVTLNTQCSSQWDGLRHYPYQNYPKDGEYTFYNGTTTEQARDASFTKYGVQNYAIKPITSRAHLLDMARYLAKRNIPINNLDSSTPIQLEWLQDCAKEHNIQFLPGDILVMRTGFTEAFQALSEKEQAAWRDREVREYCGIQQGEETLRWHWENGIAAVATDTMAYESFPSKVKPSCHEVFLSGWGMPIGEAFDLRELADKCAELNQYTFLFTSMALHVDGGIASPPNAQAIL